MAPTTRPGRAEMRTRSGKRRRCILGPVTAALVSVLLLAFPGTARAGAQLGIRGGYTLNPDQVHGGIHADLGPIGKRFSLRPNVEVGVGENLVVVALNLEGTYRFESRWEAWTPYIGGGIGLNFVDPDNDALSGSSSTESGPLILGGLEKGFSSGRRVFIESKVGLANAPDLKFTLGWTFGGGVDSEEN